MRTCPACNSGWFETYSNGVHRDGYCQQCSYEERVPTKEKDPVPVVRIEKPKPKNPFQKQQRRY